MNIKFTALLIITFLLDSCVNQKINTYNITKQECLKNIKYGVETKSEFSYFFENTNLSIAKCPQHHWNFIFIDSNAGKPFRSFVVKFPQKNSLKFLASIKIKELRDEKFVISEIYIDENSVQIK